ncbi:ATP-binding cassette, regulator of translational elongation [Mucor velutinosus]|uniref:ATP-binding cassette, regulator of translational elongation n=1 Tax=Mucor velutinosus TaxID=708070 RepID=A0AAN7DE44_9FUNG|nr:ATP-binding cassette, regulator of translational elongation [Mucor velutinosus]
MRIKISTASPLPKHQCWFPISEKLEKQSIHQLAKKMVDQFKFSTEAINLKLSMDGFELLPQSITKDLLRDGDLVILKGDHVKKPTAVKKRKSPVSPTEPEKDDALGTRPVKKTKKSKSSTTPTTSKTDAAKDKAKKVKTVKKKGTDKTLDKKKDQKEAKTESKKDSISTTDPFTHPTTRVANKQKRNPFEGLDRTKKRNMRKKLIKQRYRMLQEDALAPIQMLSEPTSIVEEQQEQQPIVEQQHDAVHELHVENLQITLDEPSEKLLKKNKNKKKNHMKGSKAENRSHVYYQEQEQPQQPRQVEEQQQSVIEERMVVDKLPSRNMYGRAFITSNESEPKYKGYRMPENHLPIHQMPTLFYANNPSHDNADETVFESPATAPMVDVNATAPLINNAAIDTDAPVDYEKLPVADFESNIPSIGDQLAIKTLELTANYTPEISDWKQVILTSIDLPNTITFVYVYGFGKTSTKGGKFDIKKHQKKRYDDYHEYEVEPQEHEEQGDELDLINEDEQEQDEVTVSVQDVFAMKNMSKK